MHLNCSLLLSVQPNVTLDGLDERTLKENDTVKLSCQIDRLYPAILPTDIAIFWGEEKVPDVKHTGTELNIVNTYRNTHTHRHIHMH